MRRRVGGVRSRSVGAVSALVALSLAVGALAAGAAQARTVYNYVGNLSADTGETYSRFASAAGVTVTSSSSFPFSFAGNSCVILHLQQQAFDSSQLQVLRNYLATGGTLIAVGEFGGSAPFNGDLPRLVMNAVSTGVGASMQLNSVQLDGGVWNTTTNIGSDPLTQGVGSVRYAGTASLTAGGTARVLLRTRSAIPGEPTPPPSPNTPFMGAQSVNGGTFVLTGDSNVLEDTSDTGYTATDTPTLARNLCGDTTPPVVSVQVPLQNKVYKLGAFAPAQYGCVDPENTNDIASVVGNVPVGDPIDTTGTAGTTVTKTFTVTCTDQSGLQDAETVTYYVDDDPPVITITTPPEGAIYEQNSSVLADFGCTDDQGVDTLTGSVPDGFSIDTATIGDHTFTVTCTDVAGNVSVKTVHYTVKDTVPPTVTITSPLNGSRYRVNQSIPGNFSCTDEDGPQDILFCTGPVALGSPIDTSLGAVGPNIFTVNASDKAGNLASKSVQYVVDASPPAVTITVPADGAKYTQGSAVNADFGCSDPDDAPPGFIDVVSCNGPVPNGDLLDTSTAGKRTFTVSGADRAGNNATKTHTYIVAGKNPPVVTIQAPANNATFALNSTIALNFSCSDPDGPEDLVSCQRVGATGPLDSSKAGTFEVTVEAVDQAGNRATKTHRYTVTAKPGAAASPSTTTSSTKKACTSRRQFTIRVKKTKKKQKLRIVRVAVTVNGKQTQVKKGRRLTAVVTLKGLPKGRYRVVIKARLSNGRTITDTRRFRTCTPKGRSS